MALRNIDYQEDYRSGYQNLVTDFYHPSLMRSKNYWRAVGYFSSSSLEAFGEPLEDFIKNDGDIRLITSIELSTSDLEAIKKGTSKKKVRDQRLRQKIEEDFIHGLGDGTARLIYLLEIGRLEIKIAVPKAGTGIYHEKIGIFLDENDYVAFSGSSNESRNAFENNRECIDVFTSWNSESRAAKKKRHFLDLWNNCDKGADVYNFPDAAKKQLITCREEWERRRRPKSLISPQQSNRWQHQEIALNKFLDSEQGILNMATGTGKTRTALNILSSLVERNKIDSVIVTTDGNDLLDQWYTDLIKMRRNIRMKLFRHFKNNRETENFVLDFKNAILLVRRQSNQPDHPLSFALKQLSRNAKQRTLLIHDEVHKLGSPGNRQTLGGLSKDVRFRLGLSATPEREYDSEGTEFILDHIGPELFRFELKDAIERGVLSPFDYHPLHYDVPQEDKNQIRSIVAQRARRASTDKPMSEVDFRRYISSVHKKSKAKLPIFDRFIRENTKLLNRCIVFVETREYAEDVLNIIHKYKSDFHTYFADEDFDILQRFARKELECLITCHRLSEGIDIQSINTVILFSSDKVKLETIQRMGRCLRIDQQNSGKIANVIDFIRRQESDGESNTDKDRETMLSNLSLIRRKDVDNGN